MGVGCKGWFWMKWNVKTQVVEPLAHNTLRNAVNSVAQEAGLKVSNSNSEERRDETDEVLSAHFLRGHAGSLAHELQAKEQASWSADLHLERARHTKEAFEKNYKRGLVTRVKVAFRNHQRKLDLRFEKALVL